MTVKIPVAGDFNFSNIMKYKPFFFFFGDAPQRTVLYGGKKMALEFFQDDGFLGINIDGDADKKGVAFLKERIAFCLGTGENFSDFYTILKDDAVLSKHYDAVYGNRLLSAFSDFEAAVSIVCSQNVTFRLYKAMVRNIVDAYGGGAYFPSPFQILGKPELLKGCGVGYRAPFILELCRYFRFVDVADPLRLSELKGFGRYSLDIFQLFQLRDYRHFYVDRLIRRIFRDYYHAELINDFEVRNFAKRKFGDFAGLAEIYLQKFLCDNR